MAEETKKPNFKLQESRFNLDASFVRAVSNITLPDDVPYEAIFEPMFWSNCARLMKRGSVVEIRNDSDTLFAQVYVRDCDRLWAKVEEISKKEFAKVERQAADAQYRVEHKGAKRRFCVIRNADNAAVKEGFGTSIDAQKWILEHERSMAA